MDNCISMLLFCITISQFDPSHSIFLSEATAQLPPTADPTTEVAVSSSFVSAALHLTTELKKWNKKNKSSETFSVGKRGC